MTSPIDDMLKRRYAELGRTPDELVDLALVAVGEATTRRARRIARNDAWRSLAVDAGIELPRQSFAWWRMALPLVAAAAVSVVLLPRSDQSPVFPDVPRLVPKGAADDLRVAVRRGDQSFVLTAGDALLPGDRIGLFYRAQSAGYLSVFFRDSSGLTRLFPREGPVSAPISAAPDGRLDAGANLHGGDGCAWVVAVFSDEPLKVAAVEHAVDEAPVSEGCELQLMLGRSTVVVPARWTP